MVAPVFLERREASSPIRNMTWSRSLALVLNPAVPYCKHKPAGLARQLERADTSSNTPIYKTHTNTTSILSHPLRTFYVPKHCAINQLPSLALTFLKHFFCPFRLLRGGIQHKRTTWLLASSGYPDVTRRRTIVIVNIQIYITRNHLWNKKKNMTNCELKNGKRMTYR